MKKFWVFLPMALAIIILVSNLDTHKEHRPLAANPSLQTHTQTQHSEQASPRDQQETSKPVSKNYIPTPVHPDKQAKASDSSSVERANGAEGDNYRYQGDVLFPYLSWDEKMRLYYHGRTSSAVRYPLGLDFQGVQQLSDNVYAINQQELLQQADKQDLLTHVKIDDSHGDPTFTEVVPGGVFDRMGIISGDQITSLDGAPIHSYADLYTAYQGIQGRHEVTIHVQRNGHDIEFTYFLQ